MPDKFRCLIWSIVITWFPFFLQAQNMEQAVYSSSPFTKVVRSDIEYGYYSRTNLDLRSGFTKSMVPLNYYKLRKDSRTGVNLSIFTPCVMAFLLVETDHLRDRYTDINLSEPMLIAAGSLMLISPSTGHFYAGNFMRPILFTSLRVASLGLGWMLGVGMARSADNGEIGSGLAAFFAGLLIGGIGFVTVTIWDIATVPRSVNEYNERISFQPKIDLGPGLCRIGLSCRF